ncbi:MAG: hypothetical protein JEZ01_21015 [Labilibaculum sp.]|nr:hypothetical protein [Labilibaculum sp.]MBI9060261.1 hypothetical protein [Labilibaculum sp.]
MKTLIQDTLWKFTENINSQTNKSDNKYYYDNNEAIRIELSSKIAKQYAGWILIEKEIRNITSWLNTYNDIVKEIFGDNIPKYSHIVPDNKREKSSLLKAIMVAIITSYGKLFTSAEVRKVKLDKSQFKNDKDKLDLHESLMELRNKFAAHGGGHEYEFVNVVLLLDSNKDNGTMPIITRELSQPNSLSYNDIPLLVELLNELKEKADQKIVKLSQKLYKDIYSIDNDFWYYHANSKT